MTLKSFLSGFLLTASLVCAALPAPAAVDGRAGIAAIVNNDIISMTDVLSRMQLYLAGAKAAPPPQVRLQMQQQILDRLIDEKLQMQEAKALGISVDPAEVQDAFARIARQNGLAADDFKKRLGETGVSIDTLMSQLGTEIAWSQVVRRKLRPQINVSENEITSALEQISRSSEKPQYQVAEIFIGVPAPAQENSVKSDAEKLVKQLTSGASFAKVAREFSQAPGAATGGDLGWVAEGQLDPLLDAALRQMRPGQISPPLRTEKGYHILFLRDMRQAQSAAAQAAPAAEPEKFSGPSVHLKQILIPVLPQDPAPVVNAKVMRAQSLKAEIASCDDMERKSEDFLAPGTGDLGTGPLNALPDDLRAIVAPLPVGVLSAPVRNEAGIAVLMVCARTEGAQGAAAAAPSLPTDASRDEIANRIGMDRLNKMQERYLRDLRATAFIDKRL